MQRSNTLFQINKQHCFTAHIFKQSVFSHYTSEYSFWHDSEVSQPSLISLPLLRLRCNSSKTEKKIRYFMSSSASAFGNSSFWESISSRIFFPSILYKDRSYNYSLCMGISEEYTSSRKPSKSHLHSCL